MNICDFPNETLLEVLQYLSFDDIHLSVTLVCKRFLQLTRDPRLNLPLKLFKLKNRKDGFCQELFKAHPHVTDLTVELDVSELSQYQVFKDLRLLSKLETLTVSGSLEGLTLDSFLYGTILPRQIKRQLRKLDLFDCYARHPSAKPIPQQDKLELSLYSNLVDIRIDETTAHNVNDILTILGPGLSTFKLKRTTGLQDHMVNWKLLTLCTNLKCLFAPDNQGLILALQQAPDGMKDNIRSFGICMTGRSEFPLEESYNCLKSIVELELSNVELRQAADPSFWDMLPTKAVTLKK